MCGGAEDATLCLCGVGRMLAARWRPPAVSAQRIAEIPEREETEMADELEAKRGAAAAAAAEEIEGHARRRANEPGPDAENADPQNRERMGRVHEEPDTDDAEAEIEGHRKLQ
jgi:hypothetical protein